MIDKFAGLPTQIRQLEKRLKEMDASKVKPALVKEITDTIQNLKNMLKEKMDKREERRKAKEQAAAPVEVEAINVPNAADVGAVSQNPPAPAATPGAPEATPDTQKVSCPLCGGLTFNSQAEYQQHMGFTHASDIMPTTPGQKLDNTVAAVEPAPVEKESRFKLDAEVKPIRGSDSKGKVMRWDGKDNDLVYVMWNEGALKERDGFGGYYPHDLELVQMEPIEANGDASGQPPHNPGPEHICPECKDWHEKHADLKTNYEALLADLKEERKVHYEQGNHSWVTRLDQKISDLEKAIGEKFPKEAEKTCPTCGQAHKSDSYFADQMPKDVNVVDLPLAKQNPADMIGVPKKEGAAQNAEDLTIMDHTPPRANSGPDAGGKDTHDEFQDEWAMPAGIELQSKMPKAQQKQLDALVQKAVYGYQINIMDMSKVYQAGEAAFIAGQDVTAAVHAFLDSMVASGKAMKTSALKAEPIKLAVFNNEFIATPLNTQEKLGGYDISQNGKKLFNIASKDGQPMSKEQLEFCAKVELTRGLKQAKLNAKIAFLEAGTTVYILAQDKTGKRLKFASMEHGLRGWAPMSKFAFQAKESEMRKHKDHIDNTYGHNGKEILVDCPNGSGNLVWLPINELLPIQAPPATPESLNEDLGKDSAKECPDCHGMFEGPEGSTCPTCGRFAVQKEALKPQLPPAINNQRMDVNAENQTPLCSVEGCKNKADSVSNGKRYCYTHSWGKKDLKEATLDKKATVVHREDGWHVLSEKGKNLGGPYKTKPEAVKRLRQVEYFKHHGAFRPFNKQVIAEVMTDPYQTLTDHITDMRGRMSQVQDKIQSVPAIKTAEAENSGSEMSLEELFADLTQGINLLEEKIEDGDNHTQIEELENKLWKLEEACGITPKLSPEEKAEPEHKEIVEDIKEKEAAMPMTDPAATPPTQNVQPTDDDNLEVPVAAPTSPPPPGQKWVFDTQFNKYVLMPDPDANRTI